MSEQVDDLIARWQSATGDSHPFGLSTGQLVELAEMAVQGNVMRTWPREGQIPSDVMEVEEAGIFDNEHGGRWRRELDEDGGSIGTWIMITGVPEDEMLNRLGRVREVVSDPPVHVFVDGQALPGVPDDAETVLDNVVDVLGNAAYTLRYAVHKGRIGVNLGKRCREIARGCQLARDALHALKAEIKG